MISPVAYYILIGALLLMAVGGAILLDKLLAWRRRCKEVTSQFLKREAELSDEMADLRSRFDELSRENPDIKVEPPSPSALYSRFIAVVEQQMGNSSLQIDEIGHQLNLSRVQLYRRIKAETGMTPNELLRTFRLNAAEKMLTTTDLTIAEIAYRVGFSSPSYFSRCFREQFGTLPQDLRNSSRVPS